MNELVDNEQTGASLLEILEELTARVEHAKSMPLSASVLINQSEVLDLLETARSIVPQQIVDADSVLQDASAVTNQARAEADSILSQARAEAQRIVAQAKQQAQQLVERDAITTAAQSQAAKIVDEARQKAQHVKRGADDYSDSQLADLADQLAAVQDSIDAVQDQIAAGRGVLAERAEAESALAANRSGGRGMGGRGDAPRSGGGSHKKPKP
ncbi:MAG: hypothetical protein PUK59_00980 [Actinomycetaceae bacterium]|nr:hypothetical protein [Actinomycetaceae bacterium]MDY5854650.1 hypothetical protein [Arcanobacterium sp.]